MRRASLAFVLLVACASEQRDWERRYDEIRAESRVRSGHVGPLPDADGSPLCSDDSPLLLIDGADIVIDGSPTVYRSYRPGAPLPPAPRIVGHLGASIGRAAPPLPPAQLERGVARSRLVRRSACREESAPRTDRTRPM